MLRHLASSLARHTRASSLTTHALAAVTTRGQKTGAGAGAGAGKGNDFVLDTLKEEMQQLNVYLEECKKIYYPLGQVSRTRRKTIGQEQEQKQALSTLPAWPCPPPPFDSTLKELSVFFLLPIVCVSLSYSSDQLTLSFFLSCFSLLFVSLTTRSWFALSLSSFLLRRRRLACLPRPPACVLCLVSTSGLPGTASENT